MRKNLSFSLLSSVAVAASDCQWRKNQEKFPPMNAAAFPKTILFEPIKHLNLPNRKCRAYKNSHSFCLNSISLSLNEEIPPNALRRKRDSSWRGGFSLGIDLGFARTGLALSKGFSVRPLGVCLKLYCTFRMTFFYYFFCFPWI